jgi:acyl carrier protein|tara:strand:+ start:2411 stop:2644 length:234 start_codon:yes stop_codon:yes gene_type:complete
MNKSQILNIIKKYSLKIYRNKNINKKSFDEIGADSLKTVEMIAELEDKLNIELSDRDLNKKAFKSVDNFINLILKKL